MNIAQLLVEQAHQHGSHPALEEIRWGQQRTLSFADLNQKSAQVAALFQNLGLQPGEKVLIFQAMSTSLYIVLLACFRLGLVATFMDPAAPADQIAACCQRIQPVAFVGSLKAHLLRLRHARLRAIPHAIGIGPGLPGTTPLSSAWHLLPWDRIQKVEGESPALLTFTSGSTGAPKGAIRTHELLLAQYRALKAAIQLQPDDRDLCTLPMFALANLAAGVTTLIPNLDLRRPGHIKPAAVIAQIQRYPPTRAAAPPAFWERIIPFCQERDLRLESLQRITTGGTPVFPRLLQQLASIAPQAEITALYGSTEAEPIAPMRYSQITPEDLDRMVCGQGLLTGYPIPQIQVRILASQGDQPLPAFTPASFESLCLSPQQPGEIVVIGEHVLKGYLDGQGNQEHKLRVGEQIWHRTGDAGYLDEGGRLWLLGRDRARVVDSQGTLYPFAVESAATQIQGIRRTALIQFRDQRLLVVEADPSPSRSHLQSRLQEALSWAHLDRILFLPHIPVDRRHNGKIDYPALRQWLTHHLS
ncbi:MAG: AMP-binding protein [Synechococcaceae cyanobacterium SM2_3_1]|nr:AMP-binding protein [Synechococcaceae cyanobacterium SM2_3_1]